MTSEIHTAPRLQSRFLPRQALYGQSDTVGWELSAEPYTLTPAQLDDIQRFGRVLHRLVQATDLLYRDSYKGKLPGWVAEVLDQGKPDSLIRFSRMNRFKSALPRVIRPDLLITEHGWALCEIDAVPGGMGFTAALSQAYRHSGFPVVETEHTLPFDFLTMLKQQVPHLSDPVIAIVLSEEAADYLPEMTWLTEQIRERYPYFYLVRPQEVDLVRDRLVLTDENGQEQPIDLIYRFFELFDLPNIPKIELIQYAVKKGIVQCTPPFKPHSEEKSVLAMLHHPVLTGFWRAQLGSEDFDWLLQWVPPGWILDPTPLPPQATLPNLMPGGQAIQSFRQLADLSQKERELILKPSGFSPLAWGGRGVTVGHDVSAVVWQERLEQALSAFPQTPHLLQQFKKPAATKIQRLKSIESGQSEEMAVRTRLCPYFFVMDDGPQLVGILATSCPADKKVIHGMKDAVLAPCQVRG